MKERKNRNSTADITLTALLVAVLCVSSYIVIPMPTSPFVFSAHTVTVNLIGLVLPPKHAAGALTTYLAMGLIGLPVFSGGTAGIGKLLGPTGGFYFGFLLAAVAISLLRGKRISPGRYLLACTIVGMPLQHMCAILMMCVHNGFNIKAAALTVSLPFIAGDILKCVFSVVIGTAVNKVMSRERL